MSVTLKHPDGLVHVEKLKSGKNRISVEMLNRKTFVSRYSWQTSYSLELIEKILEVKGPSWLCDEIMRDEDDTYVQNYLDLALLSYVDVNDFSNTTIMDFGCGCGASTMILKRILPNTKIIGVELLDEQVEVAKLRSHFYGYDNISFFVSPEADSLPHEIREFDYALLNAVYEHFLPNERNILLPKIWSRLKPNGILFINETPHRYFPIESHTTELPLINFLPDKMTLHLVRRFSEKVQRDEEWETLLRRGIRGGSVKEIMAILNGTSHKPFLLKPQGLGIKDQSDIWYKAVSFREISTIKRFLVFSTRMFKQITRLPLSPYLSLAVKKVA